LKRLSAIAATRRTLRQYQVPVPKYRSACRGVAASRAPASRTRDAFAEALQTRMLPKASKPVAPQIHKPGSQALRLAHTARASKKYAATSSSQISPSTAERSLVPDDEPRSKLSRAPAIELALVEITQPPKLPDSVAIVLDQVREPSLMAARPYYVLMVDARSPAG
jgi:hypothetical protein